MDLIALHDNRLGLRSLLGVEVRDAVASPAGQGEAGASSPAAVLDFVASTATLDRYQEVIEPAGWRLESYRRNPVFQNAHNYGDILFTLGKAVSTEVRAVGTTQRRPAFSSGDKWSGCAARVHVLTQGDLRFGVGAGRAIFPTTRLAKNGHVSRRDGKPLRLRLRLRLGLGLRLRLRLRLRGGREQPLLI